MNMKLPSKYSNECIVDIDQVTLDNEEIANHFNTFFVHIEGTRRRE